MDKLGALRPVPLLAAAVPAAVTLAFILVYGKAYPVWETWHFIPAWEALLTGGNWFAELMKSRWGHIHFIPNAVNLFVGYLTNYNMMADLLVLWVTAVATVLVFMRFMPPNPLLIAAAATAFFSMRVAEVWLNGWNLMIPLSVFLAGLMAWLLSGQLTTARVAAALLLSLLAVLTAGQGVASVAAGFIVLAFRAIWERPARFAVIGWLIGSAGVLLFFSSLRPESSGVLNNLGVMTVASALALLGHVVLYRGSILTGAALVLLGLIALALATRRGEALDRRVLFWLFIALNVLGVCGLVGLARSGEGYPVHNRYLLLNTPFLIAVASVLVMCWPSSRPWRVLSSAALAIWLASAAMMSYKFAARVNGWSRRPADLERQALANPQSLTPDQFMGLASTDRDLVKNGLATMRRLQVNIFTPR